MDNKELLASWDALKPVKTVEMGGMSDGYEMAIQLAAFEYLRALMQLAPKLKKLSDVERTRLSDRIHAIADPSIALLGLNENYGMSGAQVGAAMNMASCFYSQGYEAGLKSAGEDRHITIVKTPFKEKAA